MDLFEYMRASSMEKESPLAARIRPATLDEVVGQQHIIGKDKLLYRAIRADKLSSLIFYGPPGTGKTTLAKVIANTTSAEFTQINATVAGKKDMEEVVRAAKDTMGMYGKRTILFIDEIHRFNKGQQDYLLPFVEDGTLILIGATTENPYFEVNSALISRSIIFELKALEKEDIKKLLQRAVYDRDKGMGAYDAVLAEDAMEFLAEMAGGDARHALNAIELGIMTTNRSEDGKIHITLEVAQECIQKRVIRYDKTGDNHYDFRFYQKHAGVRPGRGGLLSGKDALCRGKRYLCGKADYDLRRRGRGKRRPAGAFRCRFRIPCGRAGGNAGGSDYSFRGGHLCCLRAQEQRLCGGHRGSHESGGGKGKPSDSGAFTGCPL